MQVLIQINDRTIVKDVRTITFELDQNILRIHLNNDAQDYLEYELLATGFPTSNIEVTVSAP